MTPREEPPVGLFKSFLLVIIAILLFTIFLPLALLVALTLGHKGLTRYFWNLAISIDQTGNVVMSELFNRLLIHKYSSNKFGNPDETISSVIGKNKRAKTLKWLGRRIGFILDKIDPGHTKTAIEDDEQF